MWPHPFLSVLFLLWSGCVAQLQVQAQSGYNYGRPDLAMAGGVTAGGRLQPGAYPTAAALPSAATTGYGAGLFPSPAVGYTPTGQATTAFGAPAVVPASSSNLPRRPSSGSQPVTSSRSGPYGPQTTQYSNVPATGARAAANGGDYQDSEGDYSAIPGEPGVDYPVYAKVPRTNFDCSQQPLPGYYADIEAQCQVFHICALNRTYSFLCPNGTVFSQETLVCVWWNQYDCVSAPSLYANNAYIYDYSERSSSNAYRPAPAGTTAYAAPVPAAGTLRTTGQSQLVGGYNAAARGSYASPTPTPTAPSQSPYSAGAIIRPAIAPTSNRLAPSGAAAGLLATAAGVLPENQVGGAGFVQQQQQQSLGNREYLPPANAAQRSRAGNAA